MNAIFFAHNIDELVKTLEMASDSKLYQEHFGGRFTGRYHRIYTFFP